MTTAKIKPVQRSERADTLVARVVAGDDEAWGTLARRAHRAAVASCSSSWARGTPAFLGDGDLEQEVAARMLERFREDQYRALTRYLEVRTRYREADPDGERSLDRWLAVVSRRLCIDYLRSLPEYRRVRGAAGRSTRQVVVSSLPAELSSADSNVRQWQCDRLDVRRIVVALGEPGFPRDQRAALVLWLEGYAAEDIATRLGLVDVLAARRLLRGARQRLRRMVPRDRARAAPSRARKRGSQ